MILSIFTLVIAGSLVVEQASAGCGEEPPLAPTSANCFPAIGFTMPDSTPTSLDDWWCSPDTEYAFVGFSYDVTGCQSLTTLKRDFSNIRKKFNGRYVRMYGSCDDSGFYNNIVEAAWDAGVGVHALIWFGFDGGDEWKTRRDELLGVLHSNAKAKFVTRVVQFGSEPLYDNAIAPKDLAEEIKTAKADLINLQIPFTISELAYGWQERLKDGAGEVMDAIDLIDAHMLPFFSAEASTAEKSWPLVVNDIEWFTKNGQQKKIYLTENGWPSVESEGVQANSQFAVANTPNEKAYYDLLDEKCSYMKNVDGGGIGWFAHVYSDDQDIGYGIYDSNGAMKFDFSPQTSC